MGDPWSVSGRRGEAEEWRPVVSEAMRQPLTWGVPGSLSLLSSVCNWMQLVWGG